MKILIKGSNMTEQRNNKPKNTPPANPVLTQEMFEQLKTKGFQATPNKQRSSPKPKSDVSSSRQNTYKKPEFKKPQKPFIRKNENKEAEMKDGVYTQPIDPFAT